MSPQADPWVLAVGYQHLAALALAVERDFAAQHPPTPTILPRPTTTEPTTTLATAP